MQRTNGRNFCKFSAKFIYNISIFRDKFSLNRQISFFLFCNNFFDIFVSRYLQELAMERKKTEIRREEIKKAVLEIIATEGVSKLSTRNLAKKVGLSEGAIFRHFQSKRDILLGIMEDVKIDLQNTLREISIELIPAKERFHKFLCAHINYLYKHQGITILLFSEAAHMNDFLIKEQLNGILKEQKLLISKIIRDGKSEGAFNKSLDEKMVATLYSGIPLSFNVETVLNKNKFNVKKFCANMYNLLSNVLK